MSNQWCDILGFQESQLNEARYTGWVYLKEGQWEKAGAIYNGLCALDPENPYHWQILGAISLLQGQYDLAIEQLHYALNLAPDHAGTKLNLAKALLYTDKRDEGLKLAQEIAQGKGRVADDAEALVLAYGQ